MGSNRLPPRPRQACPDWNPSRSSGLRGPCQLRRAPAPPRRRGARAPSWRRPGRRARHAAVSAEPHEFLCCAVCCHNGGAHSRSVGLRRPPDDGRVRGAACRAPLRVAARVHPLPHPVGPSFLIESPFPFIIGMPAAMLAEIEPRVLADLVVIDLDHGTVRFPANIPPIMLPTREGRELQAGLSLLKWPHLACADMAFPRSPMEMLTGLSSLSGITLVPHLAVSDSLSLAERDRAPVYPIFTQRTLEDVSSAGVSTDAPLGAADRDAGVKYLLVKFFGTLLPDLRSAYINVAKDVWRINKAALLFAAEQQQQRYDSLAFISKLVSTALFSQFFNHAYADRRLGASALDWHYSRLLTKPQDLLVPGTGPVVAIPAPPSLPQERILQPPTPLGAIDMTGWALDVPVQATLTSPPPDAVPWVLPHFNDDVTQEQLAAMDACVAALLGPVEKLLLWYQGHFLAIRDMLASEPHAAALARRVRIAFPSPAAVPLHRFAVLHHLLDAILAHRPPAYGRLQYFPTGRVAADVLHVAMNIYKQHDPADVFLSSHVSLHGVWQNRNFWLATCGYAIHAFNQQLPNVVPDSDTVENIIAWLVQCQLRLAVSEDSIRHFIKKACEMDLTILTADDRVERIGALVHPMPEPAPVDTTTCLPRLDQHSLDSASFAGLVATEVVLREYPGLLLLLRHETVHVVHAPDEECSDTRCDVTDDATITGRVLVTNYRLIFDGTCRGTRRQCAVPLMAVTQAPWSRSAPDVGPRWGRQSLIVRSLVFRTMHLYAPETDAQTLVTLQADIGRSGRHAPEQCLALLVASPGLGGAREHISALAQSARADLQRIGLGSDPRWRALLASPCPAIPPGACVLAALEDEEIFDLASFCRQSRFPVISWAKSGQGTLMRCAEMQADGWLLLSKALIAHGEVSFRALVADPVQPGPPWKALRPLSGPHSLLAELPDLKALSDETIVALDSVGGAGVPASWLGQVSNYLFWSNAVADLLEHERSTVVLSIEAGCDATAILASLVQILVDPHTRTLVGFKDLVLREWVLLGHPFASRADIRPPAGDARADSIASTIPRKGKAPSVRSKARGADRNQRALVFLLFLDCVHQLVRQHPTAFEFTPLLLATLGYHAASMRFASFLYDSISERENSCTTAACVWDHIASVHAHSPQFFNFFFSETQSIRAQCSMPSLAAWDYMTASTTDLINKYDDIIAPEQLTGPCAKMARMVMRIVQSRGHRTSWSRVWREFIVDGLSPLTYIRAIPTELREPLASLGAAVARQHRFAALGERGVCSMCEQAAIARGGNLVCTDCGYTAHAECRLFAARLCGPVSRAAPVRPSVAVRSDHGFRHHMKQGWMDKEGEMNKSLKRRWFCLDSFKGRLLYFAKERDAQPRGAIELLDATLVSYAETASSRSQPGPFITIAVPGRRYLLLATSPEARLEWMAAIEEVLRKHRPAVRVHLPPGRKD
eukprot:m.5860 g.5860  ORF g.5860 m.5860 type:complete len:1460 (+) comp2044_c0_seq1:389-4768(+)